MNAPGPWIVDGDEVVSLDHGKHYTVAVVQNHLFTVEANRANRDLIAAAPTMRRALDDLLRVTLDAMLAEGIALTEQETAARDQALAALTLAAGGQA